MKAIRNRAWLFFNIGWTIVYLIWRTFYTVPIGYGWLSTVAGVALLVVEIIGMLEAFVHYFNMHKIENHEVPVVPFNEYPDVDVFIATYNEPPELLYKTVNGCVRMQYPDRKKVHIYLCDDGRRPEIRKLAEQMGVGYIDREDNKGAKAGNLNHAMSVTNAPLIATFDADMIPRKEFLMVTVAYFVDQELKNRKLEEKDRVKLGFIQTPQSFYNPDLFQFNLFAENKIPNEQDYFYKDVQIARNKSNSVIYGGSNTLISREALDAVGGFYTGSITEDFATGILIQREGYVCYAINEVLASGLSPTDLKSLINQRVRWGRGCIQTGRRMHLIFNRKLKFTQKINYLASVWYWYASWKRLIYIMSPILFAAFGVMVVRCTLVEVLIFWLPMYISSNISLKMMSRNIRTTKWTNLYETIIFPFLLIPTLLETFGISMKKFKVTKKGGEKENESNWKYAIPHAILIVLSVIGIANCVHWTFETGRIDYMVILFWLMLNLYNLVMSLFFILGRKAVRNAERQRAEIPCKVRTRFEEAGGMTEDLAEGGLSVHLPYPCDISEDEVVTLELENEDYSAEVEGRVISVTKAGEGWRYAFLVVDYRESKGEYFQMIYDRVPSLPENLDESSSSFEDLRMNVSKRIKTVEYQNRRKARIPIQKKLKTNQGQWVTMVDYNYDYTLIEGKLGLPTQLALELEPGLKLSLDWCREISSGMVLYQVKNAQFLYEDAASHAALRAWIRKQLIEEETPAKEKGISNKKKRMLAEDEFSELEHL